LVNLVSGRVIGMAPDDQTDVVESQSVCVEAILNCGREIEPATTPPHAVALNARHSFTRDRGSEFVVYNERGRSLVIAEAESKYVHTLFPAPDGAFARELFGEF
jgi:hypothetical protein